MVRCLCCFRGWKEERKEGRQGGRKEGKDNPLLRRTVSL